ncbi:hypothetical protein [Legionella erythra]|uniref:Uncharacterized protein n=1 Tax=Legionella erythra TaxID=448 RepID=A0A0W0TSJ5_LEGER|nr:hypothetical protein [Legionella erythra]KTC98430.1 hypothetical protein Lery_0898 [Legionella erythra]
MMVKELIEKRVISFSVKTQAINYAESHKILNHEVPLPLTHFFDRLAQVESFSQDEFNAFFAELAALEKSHAALHDFFIGLVKAMAVSYYLSIESTINNLIQQIETNVQQGLPLPVRRDSDWQPFLPLLNYLLLTQEPRLQLLHSTPSMDFPGQTPYANQIIQYDLVFAFNALALCHAFLTHPSYQQWDLMKPILPPGYKKTTKNMTNRNEYYPYKKMFKIHAGRVGDTFFYATNGKKIRCTKLQSRRYFNPDKGNNLPSHP